MHDHVADVESLNGLYRRRNKGCAETEHNGELLGENSPQCPRPRLRHMVYGSHSVLYTPEHTDTVPLANSFGFELTHPQRIHIPVW